ncbi:MAG TPA: tetratricopeptide repeat protein [Candidatus Omnitrophota bacterium]|nr:tetratricopeptide repeat protein [Candidatus Omnitrophota bacterium]
MPPMLDGNLKNQSRKNFFSSLVLTIAALAAYSNTFHCPFIFDDVPGILNNIYIRHLWPLSRALSAPADTSVAGRPLASLSLAINYAISGLNPWSYHVLNLMLHIGSAFLVYVILRRTFLRLTFIPQSKIGPWLFSLTAAMFWLVHPLQTHAVTYVIQRAELLAGFFYFATLYAFLRSLGSQRQVLWQTIAIFLCALGMLSKEVMVTCPVMIYLYDRCFVEKSFVRPFKKRPWFYTGLVLTWGILILLQWSGPRSQTANIHFPFYTPWLYFKTQIGVVCHYLRLSVWPYPLVLDYTGWKFALSLKSVLPQALILFSLVVLTLWALIRRPLLGFLGAWFFIILSPSSSFVVLLSDVVAEKRMYLPLLAVVVFLFLVADWLLGWAGRCRAWSDSRLRKIFIGFVTLVILGSMGLTFSRNQDYQSNLSIWLDTVRKRPDNGKAWNNLGLAYTEKEGWASENALRSYAEAFRVDPINFYAHCNYANALMQRGEFEEALQHYQLAVSLNEKIGVAHFNLGILYRILKRDDEAIQEFTKAIRIDPDDGKAHQQLIEIYRDQKEMNKVRDHENEIRRILS